tara:strand:+ start:16246 stop:17928 length:1683 start_codon:yes stop_codon:yes gene_type:complete
MAKQSINLGSSANDGGGTTLRAGGDIVNDNFNELYTALGNGTALEIALGSPSTGDVLTYNGSIFTTATPSTLANIVEDTTPQLGGNLDVNAKQIVSVSNNNIVIAPNGSGAIVLDGQTWPTADGTANQVLKTDGSGNLAYGNVEAVVNIDGANDLESATLAVGDKFLVSDGGTEGRALLSQIDTLFTSTTQTLSNKTLTNPILSPTATTAGKVEFLEGTNNGTNKATLIGPASTADVTVTLPAATDTLVGKATTDTLTNKTIAGSANTLSAIANSSLTNSSVTIGSTAVALGATVTTYAGLSSVTSTNFVGDITGGITTTGSAGTTGGITASTSSSGYTADNTNPGTNSAQRAKVSKSIASGSLTKDGSTSNSFGAVSAVFNSADTSLNKGTLTFAIKITPTGGSTTSFVPTFGSFAVSINFNTIATDPSIVAAFTSATLTPSGTKTAEYVVEDALTMIDGVRNFTVAVTPSVVIGGTDDNTAYIAQVDMFFTAAADRSINIDNGSMPEVDVLKASDLMRAPTVSLATKESINPVSGLVVYDTTNDKLQVYTGGNWVNLH